MRDILTAIGAFFALNRISKMLTEPLSQVPYDWRLIRCLIVAMALMGFGMFFAYALNYMVSVWPF